MNPLDVYLSTYKARLFPCRKRKEIGDSGCKRPLLSEWQTSKISREKLLDYWSKGHPLGWSLGPEDLVVDVDAPTKDRPDKKGPESLGRLEKILGSALEAATVEVSSPSGGRHFYLTKPAGVQISKTVKDFPGVEFISAGGYVVVAGSPHWQGGTYRFSETSDLLGDFSRAPAPKSLLDLIAKDPETYVDPEKLPEAISGELLAKMLDELDPTSYRDYGDWRKLLFASHSATRGAAEGLDAFLSWSTRDPNYSGAGSDIRSLWKKLRSDKLDGISIGTLFGELKELGKIDLVRLVRASMDFQEVPTPKKVERDRIRYTLDEISVNDLLISSLSRAKNLFQRAGSLVSISEGSPVPVGHITLCEILSEVCDLLSYKPGRNGKGTWAPIRIPERVGRQIVARGSWFGIPTLRLVSPIPVFTRSGVLQTPGFHAESGVFYRKTIDVPTVPSKPTKAEARRALDRLVDVVVDFPFAGDAHRSVWLSSLLGLLARPAIDGPLPLFFFVGNQAGIGKSLLVNTVSKILYGTDAPRSTLSSDEEETRKSILAAALKNDALTLFDNLPNGSDFGSPVLDAVLTSRSIRGRLLGQTKIIEADIDTVFFATGNRIGISKDSDSFRRLAFCSLAYPDENPKGRTGFKHGADQVFDRWLVSSRARLIADGLTVLQAARAAESELPTLKTWGSYSAFSDVVRRALVWLGEPDPLDTQAEIELFNEDTDELAVVVSAFIKVIGVGVSKTTSEILADLKLAAEAFNEAPVDVREVSKLALDILAPSYMKDGGKSLAKKLKARFRDRPSGGYWIRASKDPHAKQLGYAVEKI